MRTSPFPLVAPLLCIAFAWLAVPSPALAGNDGIKRLINVANLEAQAANEQALESPSTQEDDASSAVHAGLVVQDLAAVAEFETTAASDGLDDAETKLLGELVATAQQRADGATAGALAEIASTKKLLEDTKASDERARIKLHLKSLRATVKAHRQTAAALRKLAKKLSS